MRPTHSPSPCRLRRASALCAAASAFLVLAGCRDFKVPDLKVEKAPVVTDFEPRKAFAWTELQIYGENFDLKPENNAVLLAGGLTVRAHPKKLSDTVFEEPTTTKLYVWIPEALQAEGPISVTTPTGTSQPTEASFKPMGYGHPIYGTKVVDVRFRHKPVGLYDSPETVLIASTLFNQLVNDTGKFKRLDGRAVAFGRAPVPGEALVAVRTDEGQGVLVLVDGATGEPRARSAGEKIVEALVVASPEGQPVRTVGTGPYGQHLLRTWQRVPAPPELDRLEPKDTQLENLTRVLGGAADGTGTVYLVATEARNDAVKTVLLAVSSTGEVSTRWEPNGIGEQDDRPVDPTGPIAVVETAQGPYAALGMADGDLTFVNLTDGSAWHELLVSFGEVGALVRGAKPGKVVLTKPVDGSVLQYDVSTASVDWAVQIRGEPTVLDVAPDIGEGEVAVGNNEDNGVDIIEADTGLWVGRISFSLGLGSAAQGEGGLVAPYSYYPEKLPFVIHVLARSAGMVLALDASSLDLVRTYELATETEDQKPVSEPLRLMVTHDLRTLVVHAKELGILDEKTGRERILVTGLPIAPTHVASLPDNGVVVGTPTTVTLYQWQGEEHLVYAGHVALKDSTLAALGVWEDVEDDEARTRNLEIMVTRSTAAGYVVDFYDPNVLALSGGSRHKAPLAPEMGDFLGSATMLQGPVLAFGRSMLETEAGAVLPAMVEWKDILAPVRNPPQEPLYLPSELDSPVMVGGTPDGRYFAWMSERQGVHVVRLVEYDPNYWQQAWVWSTYQLENRGSSLTFDPSGQWMYVAIPKLDLLSVFQ
ncbi:MAG TPA: hypothetical protein VGK67_08370 [Myxococcales bacterium]